MLGTPPAFILSQDRTLLMISFLWSRMKLTSSISLSSLFQFPVSLFTVRFTLACKFAFCLPAFLRPQTIRASHVCRRFRGFCLSLRLAVAALQPHVLPSIRFRASTTLILVIPCAVKTLPCFKGLFRFFMCVSLFSYQCSFAPSFRTAHLVS